MKDRNKNNYIGQKIQFEIYSDSDGQLNFQLLFENYLIQNKYIRKSWGQENIKRDNGNHIVYNLSPNLFLI